MAARLRCSDARSTIRQSAHPAPPALRRAPRLFEPPFCSCSFTAEVFMAGHSKWANIQHRKGRQDAKRGKIFSKLIKEVTVAARMGGGDLNFNPRLRLAVDKAKAENMPADNIERTIKRGTGELEGVSYEEARYEGYGIAGAAVMVDCLTDNKTRTVADVRHAFSKHGGNMEIGR